MSPSAYLWQKAVILANPQGRGVSIRGRARHRHAQTTWPRL